MFLWLCFLASLPGGQSSSAEPPPELLTMIGNRDALFRTAVIQWQVENSNPHRNQKPRPQRLRSQYGGADMLFVEEPPDPDEVPQDQRGEPWTFVEHRRLFTEAGERWSYIEGNLIGHLRDPSSIERTPVNHARSIGLVPDVPSAGTNEEVTAEGLFRSQYLQGIVSYDVVPEPGGKVTVSAHREDGVVFRWILDPVRAFAPVAVERVLPLEAGGLFVTRVTTEYAEIDGRWFPVKAELSNNDVSEWVMRVTYAEFDRPCHPQRLHVGEALQMLPGTNIMRQTGAEWSAPMIFDGEKAILASEAVEREKAGLLNTSAFRSKLAYWATDSKGAYPKSLASFEENSSLRRIPGRWEDYTRAFIQVYRLNENQIKQAWAHLRSCQRKADDHLERNRALLDDVERQRRERALGERDSGETDSAVRSSSNQNHLAELNEREARVLEVVEAIFQENLRPGLFKLLSPQQRRDGETRLREWRKPEPEKGKSNER